MNNLLSSFSFTHWHMYVSICQKVNLWAQLHTSSSCFQVSSLAFVSPISIFWYGYNKSTLQSCVKEGHATYLYTLILIKLCHILLLPLAVVTTSPVHRGDLSHFGHHKLGYANSYHSIIYTEQTVLSAPLLLHSLEYPRNVNVKLITEQQSLTSYKVNNWKLIPCMSRDSFCLSPCLKRFGCPADLLWRDVASFPRYEAAIRNAYSHCVNLKSHKGKDMYVQRYSVLKCRSISNKKLSSVIYIFSHSGQKNHIIFQLCHLYITYFAIRYFNNCNKCISCILRYTCLFARISRDASFSSFSDISLASSLWASASLSWLLESITNTTAWNK